MSIVYLAVLGVVVSQALCKCITLCDEDSERCLRFTTYEELIRQLVETDFNKADVTLQSQTLAQVVYFENLSLTLHP